VKVVEIAVFARRPIACAQVLTHHSNQKWFGKVNDLCNVLQNVLRDDVLVAQKYFALQNKTKNLAVMSGKQSKNQQKYHHPQ